MFAITIAVESWMHRNLKTVHDCRDVTDKPRVSPIHVTNCMIPTNIPNHLGLSAVLAVFQSWKVINSGNSKLVKTTIRLLAKTMVIRL
jgi:hypothetical protein